MDDATTPAGFSVENFNEMRRLLAAALLDLNMTANLYGDEPQGRDCERTAERIRDFESRTGVDCSDDEDG